MRSEPHQFCLFYEEISIQMKIIGNHVISIVECLLPFLIVKLIANSSVIIIKPLLTTEVHYKHKVNLWVRSVFMTSQFPILCVIKHLWLLLISTVRKHIYNFYVIWKLSRRNSPSLQLLLKSVHPPWIINIKFSF